MNNSFQSKNVLILGGLGFIGSNLARELEQSGANVTICDCLLEDHGANPYNIHDISNKVDVQYADIRDELAMQALTRKQDIIFNVAAHSSHIESFTKPFLDMDINVRGTLVVLEAVRRSLTPAKVVYVGTRAQYGKTNSDAVTEDHPMNPLDIYAANKMVAERYHLLYGQMYGIPVTSVRVNNTYGPRSQMKHSKFGVLNWFIRRAIENESITLHGDGSQLRDYNYIDDVVKALMLVSIEESANGEVYNLGSGTEGYRFKDLIDTIIEIAGGGHIVSVPFPEVAGKVDVGNFIASIDKIKALGWKPEIGIREGIQRTVDFYKTSSGHYW